MDGTDGSGLVARADQAMRARDARAAAALLERHLDGAPDDHDQWLKLAAAKRSFGDHVGALEASGAALKARPDSFMAVLTGGSIFEALGRREEAARAYAMAVDRAPDAVMLPEPVRRALARAHALLDADRAWRRSLKDLGPADPDAMGDAENGRLERFRAHLGREVKASDGGLDLFYPDLPSIGFYDPADFAGVADLEAATPVIMAELQALLAVRAPSLALHAVGGGAGDDAWSALNASRQWSVMNLYSNGVLDEQNAALCPETIRLYDAVSPPAIRGRSPNLMFSILDPHTRIPAHKGVTNTRLVLHIPLIIPADCAIRVGAETRAWQPGQALIFDDTLDHEAWNNSDATRIILLGDLWRPELTPAETAAISLLLGRA